MRDGYHATPDLGLAIKQAGWNVRALAEQIGYSKSHLYNVVNGRMPVRYIVAERIAVLIGGDFSLLFTVSTHNERS